MNIQTILAPNPSAFTLDGTRTYVINGRVVIDPGPDDPSHVEAILKAAPGLDTILITHRHGDHAPAAVTLKKRKALRILAPDDTLSDADVDERIHGGEMIEAGGTTFEVIATPGHTREHVCFLTPDRDLFSGDTLLGAGTTAIFPPDGDMADYLRSLAVLRARNPARVLPAHGPIRNDAVALIDQYIEHRLQREQQIVDVLDQRPATIRQLREAIYTDLDPRLEDAAEVQLLAHLLKLRDEGRASESGGVYRTA